MGNHALKITFSVFLVSLFFFYIWWFSTGAYQINLPHETIQSFKKIRQNLKIDIIACFDEKKINYIENYNSDVNFKQLSNNKEIFEKINEIINIGEDEEIIESKIEKFFKGNENNLLIKKIGNFFLIIKCGKEYKNKKVYSSTRFGWVFINSCEIENVKKNINNYINVLIKDYKNPVKFTKWYEKHRISFNLINSDPNERIVSWNFPKLQQIYLKNFIEKVSNIYNFKVDSQIINYGNFPTEPKYDKNKKFYVIKEEDIKHVLNTNDWKVESSSENEEESIKLLLYIVSLKYHPLKLQTTKTKKNLDQVSFIIPSWGGIYFFQNNNVTSSLILDEKMLYNSFANFISQLRKLIGFYYIKEDDMFFLSSKKDAISDWELDKLYRIKTKEYLQESISSLKSLSTTVQNLYNLMVGKEVKTNVLKSIEEIKKALYFYKKNDYLKSFYHSKLAITYSERSFYHPTLNNLLYFAPSQKIAIFVPLFVPFVTTGLLLFLKKLKNYYKKKKL